MTVDGGALTQVDCQSSAELAAMGEAMGEAGAAAEGEAGGGGSGSGVVIIDQSKSSFGGGNMGSKVV